MLVELCSFVGSGATPEVSTSILRDSKPRITIRCSWIKIPFLKPSATWGLVLQELKTIWACGSSIVSWWHHKDSWAWTPSRKTPWAVHLCIQLINVEMVYSGPKHSLLASVSTSLPPLRHSHWPWTVSSQRSVPTNRLHRLLQMIQMQYD